MKFIFDWDEAKDALNRKEHKVSFQEATEVFYDPLAKILENQTETYEQRYLVIGRTKKHLLLVVVHTQKTFADTMLVRIISAWKANPEVRRRYENS